MDWKSEEVAEAMRRAGDISYEEGGRVRRIMSYAVELAAARPSVEMTANEIHLALSVLDDTWPHREPPKLRQHLAALNDRLVALEAFKAYVHKRLDEAGILTHPNGQHSAAGCRIGDRLDIALALARYPSGQPTPQDEWQPSDGSLPPGIHAREPGIPSTPSEQVADLVKVALSGVPDGPGGDAERMAVHRLAALAERMHHAEQERDLFAAWCWGGAVLLQEFREREVRRDDIDAKVAHIATSRGHLVHVDPSENNADIVERLCNLLSLSEEDRWWEKSRADKAEQERDTLKAQVKHMEGSVAALQRQYHEAEQQALANASQALDMEAERDAARAKVSALHSATGCTAMHTAMVAEAGCATDAILAARAEVERLKAEMAQRDRAAVAYETHLKNEVEAQRKRAEKAEADLQTMTALRDGYRKGGMLEHERAEKAEKERDKWQKAWADDINTWSARAMKAENERDSWKATVDMYANAWKRELGGALVPKAHEIDALVVTTRRRLEDRDTWARLAVEMEREANGWRGLALRLLVLTIRACAQWERYVRASEEAEDERNG